MCLILPTAANDNCHSRYVIICTGKVSTSRRGWLYSDPTVRTVLDTGRLKLVESENANAGDGQ